MLPLLQLSADGAEHSIREAVEVLANKFQLSTEDRNELLASGRETRFANRMGWARTALKKAGLVDATRTSISELLIAAVLCFQRSQKRSATSFFVAIRST